MLRTTIPFVIVLLVVGLAALTWWRTAVPVFLFLSPKTNRRILKTGFIFGSVGLLASFGAGNVVDSARIGLVAVGAILFVDLVLLERRE